MKTDEPDISEIGEALTQIVNAVTPGARARVLREHSRELLADGALRLLDQNIQSMRDAGDNEAVGVFAHVRSLLVVCREQGLLQSFLNARMAGTGQWWSIRAQLNRLLNEQHYASLGSLLLAQCRQYARRTGRHEWSAMSRPA